MLFPISHLKRGLWFVRHNKQSGAGLLTSPTLCTAVNSGVVSFETAIASGKRNRTCPLTHVAYVSDSFFDLHDLVAECEAQFQEYERMRLEFVNNTRRASELLITQRLIPEVSRCHVLATQTFIPEQGPVQRYVSLQIPHSQRSWVLRVYAGLELTHMIRLPDVVDPEVVQFMHSRQNLLKQNGIDVNLFVRNFRPDPQPPELITEGPLLLDALQTHTEEVFKYAGRLSLSPVRIKDPDGELRLLCRYEIRVGKCKLVGYVSERSGEIATFALDFYEEEPEASPNRPFSYKLLQDFNSRN